MIFVARVCLAVTQSGDVLVDRGRSASVFAGDGGSGNASSYGLLLWAPVG